MRTIAASLADVVHLTTIRGQGEADVICGLLRAAGIACDDRDATGAWTGTLSTGFRREILVAEDDSKRRGSYWIAASIRLPYFSPRNRDASSIAVARSIPSI